MAKPRFVLVVDSNVFNLERLYEGLEGLGLTRNNEFKVPGAGGADSIMSGEVGERDVDAEKLVVFMSTFHGSPEPAIELSRWIKEANPNAKIYRRSTMHLTSPVFEDEPQLEKSKHDDLRLIEIVKRDLDL